MNATMPFRDTRPNNGARAPFVDLRTFRDEHAQRTWRELIPTKPERTLRLTPFQKGMLVGAAMMAVAIPLVAHVVLALLR